MNGVVTASGETIEPFGRSLFERASERALSRVGVVDVGSNSIHMVVFDGAARSPAYFYNEKVMAGLGQGLAWSPLVQVAHDASPAVIRVSAVQINGVPDAAAARWPWRSSSVPRRARR